MPPPGADQAFADAGKHREIGVRYGWARRQARIERACRSPAFPVRKKVTRRSRKSKARSRESMRQIRDFERRAAMAPQPSLVAEAVAPQTQARAVRSWRETTDLEKVVFGVRAVEALGGVNGYAFTLNLGPDVARRALSNPDWWWRRLARYLKRQPFVTYR
jgi:hypothetical protein